MPLETQAWRKPNREGAGRRREERGTAAQTHLPSACWGRAGWQTPRPRIPAAAAPEMPSDLRHRRGCQVC